MSSQSIWPVRGYFRWILILGFLVITTSPVYAQTVDAFNPVANGAIYAIAVQPDGKILLGGDFTMIGGQTRNRIARVNADGTLDATFNPGANGTVYSILLQAEGGFLVGGKFGTLGGQARNRLGRFNADGTLDTRYNLSFGFGGSTYYVLSLAMQSDGKLLVGGYYPNIGGTIRNGIGRLNVDGSLDLNFNPGSTFSELDTIRTLVVQSDGKIVVGGLFGDLGGQTRNCLGRVQADGSFDFSFTPQFPSGSVHAVAVQPDGKILAGGTMIFGSSIDDQGDYLARLNVDGTRENESIPSANNTVVGFALQADGKMLVAGDFTNLCGQARNYIGRLNTDNTLDAEFNISANKPIQAIAVQADGKVLVGGLFTNINGLSRSYIARLNATSAATQNLSCDGSTITWTRGSSAPEIWRATFEVSTNGNGWTSLGDAQYVSGAWQMSGLNLPVNSSVRARGLATGGIHNGSGSVIETMTGPGVVISQPLSQTNIPGTMATFVVQAEGTGPFTYQWHKDELILMNGTRVAGVNTPTLTLSNVFGADRGSYSVVISNSSGSVTSQVAVLTVIDPVITKSPTNVFVSAGQSATFNVTVTGGGPFLYQWRKDGSDLVGATGSALTLTNVQRAHIGSYDVVVSNAYGSVVSASAKLDVNLAFPDSFNGNANNLVYALTVQRDGKILVGGGFTMMGGQSRTRIARLNADGTLDMTFNPVINATIFTVIVQPDGKILVGGDFTMVNGQVRNYLAKLNPDGTLDATFNPGANALVLSMAVQRDEKILVSGNFSVLGGKTRQRIGRLNVDGTLDNSFNPGASNNIYPMIILEDDSILVGGIFDSIGGQPHKCIARLSVDGIPDSTFNPTVDNFTIPTSSAIVRMMALQTDGKILVGGHFTILNGQPRRFIGRLNADGTLDTAFNPGASNIVHALVVQTDGKILVGGEFNNLAGKPCGYLGRLNPDGSLDNTFNPGANTNVYSITVQPDGKVLAGGALTKLNGQTRNFIGRLNNTEPATDVLTAEDGKVTWLRGGTSPEAGRTSLYVSTNGVDWSGFGDGVRIPGGWQWDELSVPSNATMIVRGFITEGRFNGSGWLVQKGIGPVGIFPSPTSQTNNAGTTATFAAQAEGEQPISYQWFKDGISLTNGGGISGVNGTMLIISNVFGVNAGSYSVVANNSSGSVTSLVANLTVIDPVILNQPTNQFINAGQNVLLNVAASGTRLSYEWRKDGAVLAGATGTSLSLSNVQRSDIGGYDVVVRSDYGSVTSSVAVLNVNLATVDDLNPSPDIYVYSMIPQLDKGILLGGAFTSLAGQPRNRIGRLNPDGTLDNTFTAELDRSSVCMAMQSDGKILVGGYFTNVTGVACNYLIRLNADGTLDNTFNPKPNGPVGCLAIQTDGKILMGGQFTLVAGQPYRCLSRLNADGTLDTTFNPGINSDVHTLVFQQDGKILVAGTFSSVAGQPRNSFARLNADGTLDTAFDAGSDGMIRCVAVQSDDKIIVGGTFSNLGGGSRNSIARLNEDGSLDTSFKAKSSPYVYTLGLQADGKILVGGFFTALNDQPVARLGRFNADGSLDASFNPGVTGQEVYSLALQADGGILVGGQFSSIGGKQRNDFARLNNTDEAWQNLNQNGTNITWMVGGSFPAFWRTSFESSVDGINWVELGVSEKIEGGWQLGGITLPANAQVRARGYLTGGHHNGSSWFVESTMQLAPPSILVNDGGVGFNSNRFGFNIGGQSGQGFVLEGSTNLIDWTALLTNTLGAGSIYYSDPDSTNYQQRFYRVRPQ